MVHPRVAAVLALLVFTAPLAAQRTQVSQGEPRIPGRLLVSGFGSNSVNVYRAWDGAPRTQVDVSGAQSIVRGTDGLLYVCAEKTDKIRRIDPDALQTVDVFVQDDPLTPEDENGPLDGPTAAVFGPDGDLFVASFETDQILRFDGTTGAYEGIFVSANLGGLNGPDAGTQFGPDGFLYVPSFYNDRVLRYDRFGVFVDEFVSFREGGLRQPRDLAYHRGYWYVASSLNNRILRFDAAGNYVDIFTTVQQPYSLKFNLFDDNLYVVSLQANAVRVFDGKTGNLLGTRVTSGSGGIVGAVYLYFLD